MLSSRPVITLTFLRCLCLAIFTLGAGLPVMACNNTAAATIAICRGAVTWEEAIRCIDADDSLVPEGEEKSRAISSLWRYRDRRLVPHLLRYSKGPYRVETFWPLYANGERAAALQIYTECIRQGRRNNIPYHRDTGESGYKLALSRGDTVFIDLLKNVAADTSLEPGQRLSAASHLMGAGDTGYAVRVARDIVVATYGAGWYARNSVENLENIRNMARYYIADGLGINLGYLAEHIRYTNNWAIELGGQPDTYAFDQRLVDAADSYVGRTDTVTLAALSDAADRTMLRQRDCPPITDRAMPISYWAIGAILLLSLSGGGIYLLKRKAGIRHG